MEKGNSCIFTHAVHWGIIWEHKLQKSFGNVFTVKGKKLKPNFKHCSLNGICKKYEVLNEGF